VTIVDQIEFTFIELVEMGSSENSTNYDLEFPVGQHVAYVLGYENGR
jgi:hypothetical protein